MDAERVVIAGEQRPQRGGENRRCRSLGPALRLLTFAAIQLVRRVFDVET